MSRFYVGQRVRVIRMENPKFMHLAGMEAVVNALNCSDRSRANCLVGFTCLGEDKWCTRPENLTPITDSYDKTEWSDCLWQPDKGEVSA